MIGKKVLSACEVLVTLRGIQDGTALTQRDVIEAANNRAARYYEPILQDMVSKGWLVSKKGPTGGYSLSDEGRIVNFWDIIKAYSPEWAQYSALVAGWKKLTIEEVLTKKATPHPPEVAADQNQEIMPSSISSA